MDKPSPHLTDTGAAAEPREARWIALEELREPQPKAALAYWQAKRGDRLMPHPRDVDPIEIPKLLAHLSIVDVLDGDPPDFFYRLEGDVIASVIGYRRMGRRLSELRDYLGPVYPRASARLTAGVTAKAPLALTSKLQGLNRPFYTIELVLLPFSRDGEKVDRLVLCTGILARPSGVIRA